MLALEIGVHAGYYTLLVASAAGLAGKVFTLKSDESNFSFLVKNIEANGYGNVVALK